MKNWRTYLAILIFSLMLCWSVRSQAQNITEGNPADRDRLESFFVNPALNAFIRDRVAMTLTSHQAGVGDGIMALRSGMVSWHLPWEFRGIAMGVQYFQAGMYSQSDLRLAYGWKLTDFLALGINADLFSRSFDSDQFYRFDRNDPVFRNGTTLWNGSVGSGLVFHPVNWMAVGLSADYLNSPDISMGSGKVALPTVVSSGMKIYLGKFNLFSSIPSQRTDTFSAGATGQTVDSPLRKLNFGVEIPFEGYGLLRSEVGRNRFSLEAETPVFRNWFFNYRFDYPLSSLNKASYGTHRFGFILDLHRLPPLPKAMVFPGISGAEIPIVKKRAAAEPKGQIFVFSDADRVIARKRRVLRKVEESIDPASLVSLFPEDLGDISGMEQNLESHGLPEMDAADPTLSPENIYSPKYYGVLEGIGFQLQRANKATEILAFSGAERRANALLNVITGGRTAIRSKVPVFLPERSPMETVSVRNLLKLNQELQQVKAPEITHFAVLQPFLKKFQGRWKFEIRTMTNSVIYSILGEDTLPETLEWNWKYPDGTIVPPGYYFYVFSTDDGQDEWIAQAHGEISIIHRNRTYSIDITNDAPIRDVDADKYILILGGAKTERDRVNDSDKSPVSSLPK